MILLLLACSGDDTKAPDTSPPGDTQVVDTTASFENPAEAVDLDGAPDVVQIALTAAPFTHTIGDFQVQGYAYNGQTPGPTIRATVGDTLIVDFQNDLADASTVHWHGLALPFEMDGVAWQMGGVEPGDSYHYEFELTRAGTFWYHPHLDVDRQVDLGLYGVLIVEDPADPVLDEWVVVLDDWVDPSAPEPLPGMEGMTGLWTVNGHPTPEIVMDASRVRARVLNASNHGYTALQTGGLVQIGGDQGLLPAALSPEQVLLTPGDRADFELELSGDWALEMLPWSHNGGEAIGEPSTLMSVSAEGNASDPVSWPFPGGEVSADPGYADVVYVFSGLDDQWMINGETFPDVTVLGTTLGKPTVIEARNLSSSDHPFHLHGGYFEILSVDGVAPEQQRLEDTFNMAPRQIIRVLYTPEHLGDWMLHCHILEHEEQGMMTVFRVEE